MVGNELTVLKYHIRSEILRFFFKYSDILIKRI